MQVRTWFGIFTTCDGSITDVKLFSKDIDSLIERLAAEPLLVRGSIEGENIRDLAVKYGFMGSVDEYERLLHEVSIGLAKKKMAVSVTPDHRIISAVEAIDDLNETINILAERLKEWYLLDLEDTDLKGEELARRIIDKNMGQMPDPDLMVMQSLASGLLGLYGSRDSVEKYIRENMPVLAPNLTNLTGHILGARLLSIAGSLDRLASMPASTVQVIGASNALFKHLKGKATSPKHGAIFRHPLVNTALKHQRGKIARALASKISIAARCDRYSGELNESLLQELKAKVENIKKRYPKPGKSRSKKSYHRE